MRYKTDSPYLIFYARMIRFRVAAKRTLAAINDETQQDLLAANALWKLNQYARLYAIKTAKKTIYQLKYEIVKILTQKHQYRAHFELQHLTCFECCGTGEARGANGIPEKCYRCDGTGVYAIHFLCTFKLSISGQSYIWHIPHEKVNWTVKITNDPDQFGYEKYQEAEPDSVIEDIGMHEAERLCFICARWIDSNGGCLPTPLSGIPFVGD